MGETLEKNELIHIISIITLLTTAVLHVLAPVIFGPAPQAFFLMTGGIVYIGLGVLLILKNDIKLVRLLGFLVVAIGLSLGLTMMLLTGGSAGNAFQMTISFLYIALAIVVIILRIYLYLKV